jgi:hypothetical protein
MDPQTKGKEKKNVNEDRNFAREVAGIEQDPTQFWAFFRHRRYASPIPSLPPRAAPLDYYFF